MIIVPFPLRQQPLRHPGPRDVRHGPRRPLQVGQGSLLQRGRVPPQGTQESGYKVAICSQSKSTLYADSLNNELKVTLDWHICALI